MEYKMTLQQPVNDSHKYLCWLDRVLKLGRKSRLALLQAAAEQNLFAGEECPKTGSRGNFEKSGDSGNGQSIRSAGVFSDADDYGNGDGQSSEGGLCCGESSAPGSASLLASAAKRLYTAPEKELRFLCAEVYPSGKKTEEAIRSLLKARKLEPARIEEELLRAEIGYTCILEEAYPSRLRTIPDAPFGIYWKGKLPGDDQPAAAVIGARLASGYGREQARRFASRLGRRGICVISGMARGIDGIAQTAALEAGGTSFAVLGCGVDVCYPKENRALYDLLIQKGGILSEYAPGTQPEARLFPPRNRIISGLSDLVFVLEARKKSGTLITVDMALEQGREVYALPGRVSDSLSDGCNRLIRQGAGVATCPEDLLEFFFGTGEGKKADSVKNGLNLSINPETDPESTGVNSIQTDTRTPVETAILKTLSVEDELHLDRILEGVNQMLTEEGKDTVQLSSLIPALMKLRIEGEIVEESAGYYRRKQYMV